MKITFSLMDKGMTATNKKGTQAQVWSKIDDEQCKVLARAWSEAGMKSKAVATASRVISQNVKSYRVFEITAPALVESVMFYMENGVGFAPNINLFGGKKS